MCLVETAVVVNYPDVYHKPGWIQLNIFNTHVIFKKSIFNIKQYALYLVLRHEF